MRVPLGWLLSLLLLTSVLCCVVQRTDWRLAPVLATFAGLCIVLARALAWAARAPFGWMRSLLAGLAFTVAVCALGSTLAEPGLLVAVVAIAVIAWTMASLRANPAV